MNFALQSSRSNQLQTWFLSSSRMLHQILPTLRKLAQSTLILHHLNLLHTTKSGKSIDFALVEAHVEVVITEVEEDILEVPHNAKFGHTALSCWSLMPPCLKNLMGVMGLYEFPSIAISSNDDKPHMLSSSVCLNKPVSSVNSVFLSSSASNVWHLSYHLTMVELQLGVPVKALQSDWGGKFRPFTKFLTDSVYLINRLTSSSINFQVPYTVLFKIKLDYKFLRVFDCACFPLLRLYNSYKLDFRSQKCLFLGYSTPHKGYRCLASNVRLYIAKDVPFNESRFPYQDLFSNPTPFPSSPIFVSLPALYINPFMSPLLTHSDVQSPASRLEPSNSQTVSSDTGKTVSNSMVQYPLVLASSTESSHESESSYDHLVPSIQPSESNPTQLSNSAQSSNTSFTLSSDNPTTSSTSSLLSITPKVVPIPRRPINSHTMQTRAKFGFSQPKLEPRLLLTHSEPKTVKQALADLQWKAAMQADPVHTPMQSTCKLTKTGFAALSDPYMYRSVVGALHYATVTRPDIAFSVNKVCQFMAHPLESHGVAVKRILRRNTFGATIYFDTNLWRSKTQPVVASLKTDICQLECTKTCYSRSTVFQV
ncbi:hypothetical protein KIW84_010265 [Lathyrus oleraceus]|uniref:Retroviral polymerase SH3-like domain-containing protein n=1 Tax=Pisum sativum TaxID=3888 RepID=A0A9D4YJH3_PEA|nr:hypothetical protein KIW84_010265 [Pisum sativum]